MKQWQVAVLPGATSLLKNLPQRKKLRLLPRRFRPCHRREVLEQTIPPLCDHSVSSSKYKQFQNEMNKKKQWNNFNNSNFGGTFSTTSAPRTTGWDDLIQGNSCASGLLPSSRSICFPSSRFRFGAEAPLCAEAYRRQFGQFVAKRCIWTWSQFPLTKRRVTQKRKPTMACLKHNVTQRMLPMVIASSWVTLHHNVFSHQNDWDRSPGQSVPQPTCLSQIASLADIADMLESSNDASWSGRIQIYQILTYDLWWFNIVDIGHNPVTYPKSESIPHWKRPADSQKLWKKEIHRSQQVIIASIIHKVHTAMA